MTTETLFFVGDLIMLVGLLGAVTFAVSYAAFFAWRRTSAGRSLMYFVVALIVWAGQSFLARMDPDYPGRAWSRIVVYALIAGTIWRLVVTLWRSWETPFSVSPRKSKEE